MKNDPKQITAKFPGKCAESGKAIPKGAQIIYWPSARSSYLIGHAPKAEQQFRLFKATAYEEDNGFCIY